jgi:hypothetical protein
MRGAIIVGPADRATAGPFPCHPALVPFCGEADMNQVTTTPESVANESMANGPHAMRPNGGD